ncbi:MAG: ATP-binding protein [Myxococcota bacterium]
MIVRRRVAAQLFQSAAWENGRLDFAQIGAAAAICEPDGKVVAVTPEGERLLEQIGIAAGLVPFRLPQDLLTELASVATGESVNWAPAGHQPRYGWLSCARYPVGRSHSLLVFHAVSAPNDDDHEAQSPERRDAAAKLVLAIARDMKATLANVVQSVDSLRQIAAEKNAPSVHDAMTACLRLSENIDRLVGYAIPASRTKRTSIRDVFARVERFLAAVLREGDHSLETRVDLNSVCEGDRATVLEQVLVCILLNAADAGHALQLKMVAGRRVGDSRQGGAQSIEVSVSDSSPDISAVARHRLFERYFSIRNDAHGLCLSAAREAVRELGGELCFVPLELGAKFAIRFPVAAQTTERSERRS